MLVIISKRFFSKTAHHQETEVSWRRRFFTKHMFRESNHDHLRRARRKARLRKSSDDPGSPSRANVSWKGASFMNLWFLGGAPFWWKKTLRDNNKGHLALPGGEPVVKLASIISKHILHENGAPPRNASFMNVAPFRETYASRVEPESLEALSRRARLRDRLRNASDNPGSYLEAHVSRTRCTTKKHMFYGGGTILCNKRFELRTMSIGYIK